MPTANLKPAPNSTKNRTLVKDAVMLPEKVENVVEDTKDKKSRSGYSRRAGFEGGQMPLYKRLPKLKGLNLYLRRLLILSIYLI